MRLPCQLNDPGSFEWYDSAFGIPSGESLTVFVAGADGRASFIAKFRARNAFGGLIPGEALGYIVRHTCDAVVTYIN